MSDTNIPSRVLHDLGLAAWFGGTLANAVALNRAAGQTSNYSSAGRVANVGWDAWAPVNAVAIGAHLIGSVGQLQGNKARLVDQRGVASMSVVKTLLTVAALGATAYSRVLGRRVSQNTDVPVESGTERPPPPRRRWPRPNASSRFCSGWFRGSPAPWSWCRRMPGSSSGPARSRAACWRSSTRSAEDHDGPRQERFPRGSRRSGSV